MSYSAGNLDRRIRFEVRSTTRDADNGSEVETWTPAASEVWASVGESSTADAASIDGGLATYARPHRIMIRYRSGVTRETHRVLYQGQTLRIIGIAERGTREMLELSCKEWAHE